MPSPPELDALIIGGGVAGLWILNALRQQGYSAALMDHGLLGDAQTVRSQGILHRGAKYLLDPNQRHHAAAFPDLIGRWQSCLEGQGEIDLRSVQILAPGPWIRPLHRVSDELHRRLTSALDEGTARREDPPPELASAEETKSYRFVEPVLDLPSLLAGLASEVRTSCFHMDPAAFRFKPADDAVEVGSRRRPHGSFRARRVILAAGAGNAELLDLLSAAMDPGRVASKGILRPLHMVVARGPHLPRLWLHAVEDGGGPVFTITSHPSPAGSGQHVWYVGGRISEEGLERTSQDQIDACRRLLGTHFPRLELSSVSWSTFRVERAEHAPEDGVRRLTPQLEKHGPILVAWPQKLVLAPLLADEVIATLQASGVTPSRRSFQPQWPAAATAGDPYERLFP